MSAYVLWLPFPPADPWTERKRGFTQVLAAPLCPVLGFPPFPTAVLRVPRLCLSGSHLSHRNSCSQSPVPTDGSFSSLHLTGKSVVELGQEAWADKRKGHCNAESS